MSTFHKIHKIQTTCYVCYMPIKICQHPSDMSKLICTNMEIFQHRVENTCNYIIFTSSDAAENIICMEVFSQLDLELKL